MTRTDNDEPESNSTDSAEPGLSEAELESMGRPTDVNGIDSGIDRIYLISGSLHRTDIMNGNEAQAFAFCEVADVCLQRTAAETNMTTSEVKNALRSAQRKVDFARKFVEILDDCGC